MDDLGTYRARIGLFSFSTQKTQVKPKLTIRGKKPGHLSVIGSFLPDASFQPFTLSLFMYNFCVAVVLYLELAGVVMDHFTTSQICSGHHSLDECRHILTVLEGCVVISFLCHYLLGNKGVHTYNGNPYPERERRAKPDNGCTTLSPLDLYSTMLTELNKQLHTGMKKNWNSFKANLKWKSSLPKQLINEAVDMIGICDHLLDKGDIQIGSYDKLRQCFDGHSDCLTILDKYEPQKKMVLKENASTRREISTPINVRSGPNDAASVARSAPQEKLQNLTDLKHAESRTPKMNGGVTNKESKAPLRDIPKEILQVKRKDFNKAIIREPVLEESVKRLDCRYRKCIVMNDSETLTAPIAPVGASPRSDVDSQSDQLNTSTMKASGSEEVTDVEALTPLSTRPYTTHNQNHDDSEQIEVRKLMHNETVKRLDCRYRKCIVMNDSETQTAPIAPEGASPRSDVDSQSDQLNTSTMKASGSEEVTDVEALTPLSTRPYTTHNQNHDDSEQIEVRKLMHNETVKRLGRRCRKGIVVDDSEENVPKQKTSVRTMVIGDNNLVINNDNNEIRETIQEGTSDIKHSIRRSTEATQQKITREAEAIKQTIKSLEHSSGSKLQNIVGQTEAWIAHQQKSPFVKTKAFADAQSKLLHNKLVIVKGNTGDGKTRMSAELLHWLTRRKKYPPKRAVHLKDLKTWDDVICPRSCLAILIDDVLRNTSELKENEIGWMKIETFIMPVLDGKVDENANCIILTIRNDIFEEHKSLLSSQEIFNERNIIDLSSAKYSLKDEREKILNLYMPSFDFEPFSEEEINSIVTYSPGIGFPECCRIFMSTPHLHRERASFFTNPLRYMKDTIRLKFGADKHVALFYLLLSGGNIHRDQFDPGNESVNRRQIKKYLNISFTCIMKNMGLSFTEKMKCLQHGLESLCGSFVKSEKDVYNFFHDSIHDAVAILYAEISPRGFLKNCDSTCLRHIVTPMMRNRTCKCLIERRNFKYLYKRILVDLKSGQAFKHRAIASLLTWYDEDFLSGFFDWIGSHSDVTDDFAHTFKAKYSFLTHVVKMDNVVLLEHLIRRNANGFGMKHALDVALSSGKEECTSVLLESGFVQPDDSSCFAVVQSGNMKLLQKITRYGIIQTAKAKKSKTHYVVGGLNILQEACLFQREEMVTFLLKLHPSLLEEKSTNGYNTLHFIARTGNFSLYKTVEKSILSHKSSREAQKYVGALKTADQETVLHMACLSGKSELCLYLCKQFPALLQCFDAVGYHCLHYVAMTGNAACYKEVEAMVMAGKSHGESQLFMSAISKSETKTVLFWACLSGSQDLCLHLCKKYPFLMAYRGWQGRHCLHIIARSNDVEWYKAAESLVLKQMNEDNSRHLLQNLKDDIGGNLLHNACGSGSTEICKYLYKKNKKLLDDKDKDGWHCLHYAVLSGNTECYKTVEGFFLEGKPGSSLQYMKELTDKKDRNVLHWACLLGRNDMCSYLCDKYPDLFSERDKHNWHCLHFLAYSSDMNWYEALVQGGSRENAAYIKSLLTDDGSSVRDIIQNISKNGKNALSDYHIQEKKPCVKRKKLPQM